MKLPEKVTEYGRPYSLFTKIEETYERRGDVLVIRRRIWMKTRMDFVVMKYEIAEDAKDRAASAIA